VKVAGGMHCPSLNIFGTFFPSWMLSALIGLVAGVVAYKVFSLPSIILTITFIVWLFWYGQ
jgi:hypothetical protein